MAFVKAPVSSATELVLTSTLAPLDVEVHKRHQIARERESRGCYHANARRLRWDTRMAGT